MGWKCAPQVMGLVRGDPKPGQKHRGNIRKIALEAGYERASRSDTLDRRRSHLNKYEGYKKGAKFADDMEQEAAEYRMKVKGKTKDGQEIIREKGLPHNAVIGWAVIYNPPAEVCASWTDEDYEKFHQDCRDCMAEIEPRLFRQENIRMSAEHFDEGIPVSNPSRLEEIDRHFHDLGVSKDEDGRYCGNLIDAKLLIKINERFPVMMRKRGWNMDDLDTTDFERAKVDKDYAAERNAKRKQSGLSVNKHLNRKAQKLVEDAAEVADQAVELRRQVENDAAIRQRQLDEVARRQAAIQKRQDLTAQEQEDTQKKQDKRAKGQKNVLQAICDVIKELGGSIPQRFTYSGIVEAIKAAKDKFVEMTIAEAKQIAREEVSTEFQKRKHALDTQRAVVDSVLNELMTLRDKMRTSTDRDISRKRFMEAHRAGGRTLEEIYQADIAKKLAQKQAFIRRAEELTVEYDAIQYT